MPTSIEAQGVTVEEAIQVALNQLGVTRDRVEIEIIHHPRSGFLGLGARRAKVRATLREAFLADGEEYDMSTGTAVGRGRRSRRSRRRRGRKGEARGEDLPVRRAEEGSRNRDERRQDSVRGRHAKGRGSRETSRYGDEGSRPQHGGERGRRGTAPEPRPQRAPDFGRKSDRTAPREPRPQRQPEAVPPPRQASGEVHEPEAGHDMAPAPYAERERPASAAPPGRVLSTEEVRQRAESIVEELLMRMGFRATVASFFDEPEGEVVIKVDADTEGLLIGRRGQTLDALEHLLNRMVISGESTGDTRIAIDVGGYRARRRETLLELADRLKVRALTQGRRIQVSPMSPRDRRILQGALGHDDAVRTRVLGSGFYRRITIFPVGLDEESVPMDSENEEGAEADVGAEDEEGA